jgi:hypothetical protein
MGGLNTLNSARNVTKVAVLYSCGKVTVQRIRKKERKITEKGNMIENGVKLAEDWVIVPKKEVNDRRSVKCTKTYFGL